MGTGVRTTLQVRTTNWGELRIYAPSKDRLKDVFVLSDADATGLDDAIYWCELCADQAVLTTSYLDKFSIPTFADRSVTTSTHYTLVFDWEPAEGKVARKREIAPQLRFTLRHRPSGSELGERVVFEERSIGSVFKHTGILYGSEATVETVEPFMAGFLATGFQLSDEIHVPERRARAFGVPLGCEAPETPALSQADASSPPDPPQSEAPATGDTKATKPSAPDPSDSVEPVASAVRTWALGETPLPAAVEDYLPDGDLTPLHEAAEDAATWVYLFATHAEPLRPFAPGDGPAAPPVTEFLGAWTAETSESLRHAAYEGNDPDEPPTAGEASPYALVDASRIRSATETVFAYASAFPLPRSRVDVLRETLDGLAAAGRLTEPDRTDGLVSLYVGAHDLPGDNGSVFAPAGHHFTRMGGARTVSLSDPVRTTYRLATRTVRASQRYEDWRVAVQDSLQNANLVVASARGPVSRRTYLDALLKAPDPISAQWAAEPESDLGMAIEGVPEEPETLVEGFLYGVRRQSDKLNREREAAAARLEAWVDASSDALHLDLHAVLATAPAGSALAQRAEVINEILFDCETTMAEAGHGGHVISRRLRGTPIQRELPRARPEGVGDLLERSVGDEDAEWTVRVRGTAFEVWWSLAKRSGRAGLRYLQTLGPVLISLKETRAPAAVAGDSALALQLSIAYRLAGKSTPGVEVAPDGSFRVGAYRYKELSTTYETPSAHPGGGTNRQTRVWTSHLEDAVEVRELRHYFERAKMAASLDDVLMAASIGIATYAIYEDIRGNRVNRGTALLVIKTSGEVAGLAISVQTILAQRAGLVGKLSTEAARRMPQIVRATGWTLKRSVRYTDLAIAASRSYDAYTREVAFGVRNVSDADELAVVGAVMEGAGAFAVSTAGGIMIAKGLGAASATVVGAITVGWLAVIGLVAAGVGAGLRALSSVLEERSRAKDDPLTEWLPLRSVWGEMPSATQKLLLGFSPSQTAFDDSTADRGRFPSYRISLVDLVTPDGDLETVFGMGRGDEREVTLLGLGHPSAIEAQTKSFLETAFRFPVHASIVPSPLTQGTETGAGCVLVIEPQYLPTSAVLLVSVEIGIPGNPVSTKAKCTVRYWPNSDGGYSYRVEPPMDPPDGTPQIRSGDWATAQRTDDDRVLLTVRIGRGIWPLYHPGLSGPGIADAQAAIDELGPRLRSGNYRLDEREALRSRYNDARGVLDAAVGKVSSATVLEPSAAALRALAAPGAAVTAAVFFRPLAPNQTTQHVPDAGAEVPLVAVERYPDTR